MFDAVVVSEVAAAFEEAQTATGGCFVEALLRNIPLRSLRLPLASLLQASGNSRRAVDQSQSGDLHECTGCERTPHSADSEDPGPRESLESGS